MKKRNFRPWLLLLPAILIIGITIFIPVIRTFAYSLYNYKLTAPNASKFIGLDNYINILKSDDFHRALSNSLFVLVLVLLLVLVSAIFVALILNKKTRISSLLTAIAIVPWALPPIVNGIIWKFIFQPGYGLANKVLLGLGIISQPISWTTNRWSLLAIVAIVVAWRVVPFCAMIILSNLQNIPNELYEAARVDGSNGLQEFSHITLPMIIPSLAIVLVQATMGAINVFDEVIALAGQRLQVQTLIPYNYMNTFSFLNFGYGSAISYIIMIISGIFGYFYIKNMSLGGRVNEAKK